MPFWRRSGQGRCAMHRGACGAARSQADTAHRLRGSVSFARQSKLRARHVSHNSIPDPRKSAQIAPLTESVPPKLYGGTERVVSYLTEELIRLGHDVTLFASGDSETS